MTNAIDVPPPLPEPAWKVLSCLEKARRPLIISHIRLDGDAAGSELGLAHILRLRGVQPHIVNDSPVPEILRFLPGADEIGTSPDEVQNDYDLVIALDMATRDRAPKVFERLDRDCPVVAVDHHPPVAQVGDPEWKDPSRSSVGEMIHELAAAACWRVPSEAATCLYAAILTDTGRFTFPNTTPSALRAAASLMELGAECARISEHVYEQEPCNLMALRAEVMQSLTLYADGRIAVMRITHEMMKRRAVSPADIHQFSDMPRGLAGVAVGVLLTEMKKKVKVSLRSRQGVNVETVARRFRGGGHVQAAGCEVQGDLAQAEREIADALTAHLTATRTGGML